MIIKLILKIYIILTFVYFLVASIKNQPLKSILILSASNIIITDIFIHYNISFYINSNIYTILHAGLWIYILHKHLTSVQKKLVGSIWAVLTISYLCTTDISATYYNRYFPFTSILYIIMFLLVCVKALKKEDIEFFQSKQFILIFSPVMYFLGMSFIFAFIESGRFSEVYVFGEIGIYEFINFVVNVIYYSLINYYIYKSKKNV